mgnify:CR=1 FL=1
MPRFFDPCPITSCAFPTTPHNHPPTAEEWARKVWVERVGADDIEQEYVDDLAADFDAYARQQVEPLQAEIRQLREECGRRGGMSNPHLEAISWCCDEHRQKSANEWIAHRAVVRELAQLLTNACTMRQNGGFVGDNIDRWLTSAIFALAHPLVQQAQKEERDA